MRHWLKSLAAVLVLTIALASVGPPVVGLAAVLYEYKERTVLAKGVVYEQNRQMTDAGMLDVHILTVPLNDPYIYVGPVDSQKEPGLKETASALLSASGAIAGTNGDFFGLAGTYSVPFGPVVEDGRLKSAGTAVNASGNEFATLILDDLNYPFMRYMRTDIRFYNNGAEHISIASYNKVGEELAWPTVIDRQLYASTEALDARFPGLVKVAVDNGAITYVSQKGEPVTVPKDGYVLVIPAHMADSHRGYFRIGERAVLEITNNLNLDVSKVRASIGGGGLILSAGKTVHDAGTVIAGRQPRTAVGVSQDGRTLILMTVDGRTHSVGATHEEMAALLLSYGAYDAMHLDGGGSATMVVKQPETDDYAVVNTLSDGAERRIINALGVFDRSPVGELQKLGLRLAQSHVFVGMAVEVEAYGQDAYLHTFPLPEGVDYTLDFAGPDGDTTAGTWAGGLFVPYKAGVYGIRAVTADGRLSAHQTLIVHDLAELQCSLPTVRTLAGMTVALDFNGIGTDGAEAPVSSGVTVQVVPSGLGTVQEGVFTAQAAGTGYLDCALNGVHTYVPLSVGGYGTALAAFDKKQGLSLSFSGYPNKVTGSVRYEDAGMRMVTRLDYHFEASNETQAAYVNINPAVHLPVGTGGSAAAPLALRMQVYGDASGHWLRGRVRDANGEYHNIDFTQTIDFTGWQTVTALLPTGVAAPFTLDRVYVAATVCETERSHTLYFDGLEVLYAAQGDVALPEGDKYRDPLRVDLNRQSTALDFTLQPGPMAYGAKMTDDAAVITLSAAKGGLYATDAMQWQWLTQDIKRLNPAFVIILMDEDPLRFTQPKEFELFHRLLASQKMYGRQVFVVSASAAGETAECTLKDGVRYISLPGGGATIRFKTAGKQIWFDTGA